MQTVAVLLDSFLSLVFIVVFEFPVARCPLPLPGGMAIVQRSSRCCACFKSSCCKAVFLLQLSEERAAVALSLALHKLVGQGLAFSHSLGFFFVLLSLLALV